ncbi:MAG: Thioesterase [Gemmatimonadetes bacterium]|nr:Thioesterase [Gemmatimonadota bacterium]
MTPKPSLSSWISTPRPNPASRLRLFCFPYAGGGASIFYTWPGTLPPDVELCPVQLPGREARLAEPPYRDMMELVARLGEVLEPHMDRPFAFFGHSNGAIMSFELARLLRRQGRRMPLHLFLSGRAAPHVPLSHPPVHELPEPAFSDALRRLQGTPEEILANAEIMALITPLLRADFSLAETYACAPEEPLDVPVTAYGGDADPDVTPEDVEGWSRYTRADFDSRIFPGGHFFLNTQRAMVLAELARNLAAVTARAARA